MTCLFVGRLFLPNDVDLDADIGRPFPESILDSIIDVVMMADVGVGTFDFFDLSVVEFDVEMVVVVFDVTFLWC